MRCQAVMGILVFVITSFLLVGRYSHVRLSRRAKCAPCPEQRTVMLVRARRGRQRRLRLCSSLVGARAEGKRRVQHAKVFGVGLCSTSAKTYWL
jgi:hypothetical protein